MVSLEKCLNPKNDIESKVRNINRLFANDTGREESLMFIVYEENGIEKSDLIIPIYCGKRTIISNGELVGYSPNLLEFYSNTLQEYGKEKLKRTLLVSNIMNYLKLDAILS